jgi:hypothetical protein
MGMKHQKHTVLLAAMCTLAGCGETATNQSAAHDVSASGAAQTNYQQAVMELPQRQRDVVLFRAIRDAGLACQYVVSSERVPDERRAWRAQCEGGSRHLISIGADGIAMVVTATS